MNYKKYLFICITLLTSSFNFTMDFEEENNNNKINITKNKKNKHLGLELIYAAQVGNLSKIQELIKSGAKVNAQDECGKTALMEACIWSNKEIAKLLIKNEADTNIQNIYGWTALMNASYNGDKSIIALLIKFGTIIETKNKKGQTAITIASLEGHKKISIFLEEAAKKQKAIVDLFIKIIKSKNYEYVKKILNKFPYVLKFYLESTNRLEVETHLLEYAIENSNLDLIRHLIEKEKISIHGTHLKKENNKTIWHIAAEKSQTNIINYLTKHVINKSEEKDCGVCMDCPYDGPEKNRLTITDFYCFGLICSTCKINCKNKYENICPFCREKMD